MAKLYYGLYIKFSDEDEISIDEISNIKATYPSIYSAQNAIKKNAEKIKNIAQISSNSIPEEVSIVEILIDNNDDIKTDFIESYKIAEI